MSTYTDFQKYTHLDQHKGALRIEHARNGCHLRGVELRTQLCVESRTGLPGGCAVCGLCGRRVLTVTAAAAAHRLDQEVAYGFRQGVKGCERLRCEERHICGSEN